MPPQDIYDRLKKDHREVEDLLERLCATGSGDKRTREKLFKRLKEALDAHSKAEEQVFYKRLQKADKTHDEVLEAKEEHSLVKNLLSQMNRMDVTDDRWHAKLMVVKELVTHHIEEEEGETFPDAHQVLSDQEAQAIGEDFSQRKKTLKKTLKKNLKKS